MDSLALNRDAELRIQSEQSNRGRMSSDSPTARIAMRSSMGAISHQQTRLNLKENLAHYQSSECH